MTDSDKALDDAEAARKAAWVIYTEMRTRVTTVRMRYRDGDDKAALTSVYSLFKTVRDALKEAGPAAGPVANKAFKMLNEDVRPFTGKWHHRSLNGKLSNNDHRREFRRELNDLKAVLLASQAEFAELAQFEPEPCGSKAPLQGSPLPAVTAASSLIESLHPSPETADVEGVELPDGTAPDDRQSGESARDASRDKHKPVPIQDVLREELVAVAARRTAVYGSGNAQDNLCGLCLSGGGIRSATFALGVLTSLGSRGILRHVDYLSTVSGGGYLGGYIMSRLGDRSTYTLDDGTLFDEVQAHASDAGDGTAAGGSSPATHLRNESFALGRDKAGAFLLWLRGLFINCALLASAAFLLASVLWVAFTGLGGGIAVFALISDGALAASLEGALRVRHLALFFAGLFLIGLGCRWAGVWHRSRYTVLTKTLETEKAFAACGVSAGILALLCQYWVMSAQANWWQLLGFHAKAFLVLNVVFAALTALAAILSKQKRFGALMVVASPVAKVLVCAQGVLVMLAALYVIPSVWLVTLIVGLSFGVLWFARTHISINRVTPADYYRDHLAKTYLDYEHRGAWKLGESVSARAPFHLINATLNLPSSKNAILRGRKGDMFVFSRLFSGSPILGFFDSKASHLGEHSYATCIATSGAAASPLMGHRTRPSMSAWFAVLNIRLAAWLPNPRHKCFETKPPATLLRNEMLLSADEESDFINLSDGGHSENLGIYELIRRRCQTIICVDGEADKSLRFDGMIRLMRLAKIDFDVDIDIDLSDIRHTQNGQSYAHFALGSIVYPARGDEPKQYGYLLYIKSSMTGNEPEPITDFKRDYPSFPHQSTVDQFFSETQFEAYRALGQHIGEDLFADLFDKGWAADLCQDLGVSLDDVPEALRNSCNTELRFTTGGADDRVALQWFFARLVQMLDPDALPDERDPTIQ